MSEGQLIETPCAFGENGSILLERELGRGGMGGVYMGRDKMLDRPVAVKVMLREYGSDPAFVEKFKREAQAAARLIHPNIAQIYSYGISDGMPYIAMELVAGGSLDRVMANAKGGTDVPRVMKICEQVAQALRCAADQGLVHGDVKPENVLLDANGNAKLVDFGLAAMQTDTDEIWGTPYYIAPEKVRKQPVDYRADMYSLGGTIYHALTGVAPFEGEDANAVVRKRFDGAPKPPSEVRPGLSPQIDALVLKMLSLDPAERYPSFEALLEDFKKVMASGLSSSQSAAQPAAPSQGGGRRLTIKPRKKFAVKKASSAASSGDGGGDVAEMPDEEGGAAPARSARGLKTSRISNGESDGYDEEEEGGVGGKVALVIGGIVGAIVLVAGGLYGLKVMNEKGNAAHDRAAISGNIDAAYKAIAGTKHASEELREKVDSMASALLADCRKVRDDVSKILDDSYPDEVRAMLDVPKTAEVIAAEKALLAPAPEEQKPADAAAPQQGAAAVPAEAQAAVQAVADAAQKMGEALSAAISAEMVAKGLKFRDPVGDEADPNSPEGEAYQKEKAAWQAEMKAKAEEAAKNPPPAAAPAAAGAGAAPEAQKGPDIPPIVNTVRELWEKTYAAQAAALRTRKRLLDLESDIEAAMTIGERTKEEMDRLAKASNEFKARYDSIFASADVTLLQKTKGTVKDRGEKAIKKAVTKFREQRLKQQRLEEKKRREEEDKAREERKAAEKAKRAEEETAAAATKFDAVCADGNLRQLDWEGARRKMRALRDGFTTPEGEIAADEQLRKIAMMESVHKILMRNIKGYVFVKATPRPANPKAEKQAPHLRGMEVLEVDAKQIVARKAGAASAPKKRISWQTFYRDYHANFGEICNRFIFNGRKNGEPKLNLRDQSEALLGLALTMQIVCSEDPSAAAYCDNAAKAAVKVLPSNSALAKKLFPNVDFSELEKAAEAENL